MKIGLLNLDVGNIRSVYNVLKKISNNIELIDRVEEYDDKDVIFLSGVSSFDNQIHKLKEKNFYEIVKVEKNKKIVGICSGMQIMFSSSSEGKELGLNIFDESLKKFSQLPSTHIGWNKVFSKNENINDKEFYFCHSYYAPVNEKHTIAKCHNGVNFSCIVNKDNFFGIQFHPEKSGNNGLSILKSIINI